MTDPNRPPQSPAPLDEPLTPVLRFLSVLLREWRVVLGWPIATAILGVVIALTARPTYTATTTFIPAVSGSSPTLPTGLAGLASEFGLNVGRSSSFSPDFFAEVLTSRELLRGTLLSSFDDPTADAPRQQQTLLDILKIKGKTEEERIDKGIRKLKGNVFQSVDRRTGIVTLRVAGRPAVLVAAVANRMVDLLNKFNVERLQSQSRERRRFAEERVKDAERELRAAEAQHLKFLQSNRRYADSPLLSFEQNRLGRQVQQRQEVFQTLTREFEEARIAEVRDTPLLTIIDPAVPPDRRSAPRRKLIVLLAMIAGALFSLAWVYLADYRRAAEREGGTEYRSLIEAWHRARGEMRRAIGLRKSP